jgi:alpha-mannosidase II
MLNSVCCSLSNVHISADFGPDGMLQSITSLADKQRTACRIQFVRYGTRHSGDRSGAYLFLPDGPGRESAVSRSPVRVVEGPLRAYVEVQQGWNTHRATLLNSPGMDGTAVQASEKKNSRSNFWIIRVRVDPVQSFFLSWQHNFLYSCQLRLNLTMLVQS